MSVSRVGCGNLTDMTIWLSDSSHPTASDPSLWLPDYTKAGVLSPLDAVEWYERGVCACGHPAREHLMPRVTSPAGAVGSPEYENDDRPDMCQGVFRTRPDRNRRYFERNPDKVCQCRRVRVVMRPADLRYFGRQCGDTGHPFTLGLEALIRAKGPEKAVRAWLRPPVCRWEVEEGVRCGRAAADGHLVQMHYTARDRSSSDWYCLEHLNQSLFGVRDAQAARIALDPES